jgi:hypothetical protein
LAGRRVGVRTYSQTTGVWVRGILQNEYGVELDRVTWITFDDSHLAEYSDPPNCQRAPEGKKLVDMLLNGEIDAALLGSNMPQDPRIKTLIPDAEAAALAWSKEHGVIPINHMYVVKQSLCQARPDVVREIYRMLLASRAARPQPAAGSLNMTPSGEHYDGPTSMERLQAHHDRMDKLARVHTRLPEQIMLDAALAAERLQHEGGDDVDGLPQTSQANVVVC